MCGFVLYFSWSKVGVIKEGGLALPQPWLRFPPLPGTGTTSCWLWQVGPVCWSAWRLTLPEKKDSGHGRRGRDKGLCCEEQSGGWEQLCCHQSHGCYGRARVSLSKAGWEWPSGLWPCQPRGWNGRSGVIWQCTTAPSAEREGEAKEGRSWVLLVPTKGWWWLTGDWVKFGQTQHSELIGSACIHHTSHSWKHLLHLGWCFWSAVEM